jgi:aryl-phospho-beta-D-glucosidase BglC (GH1 family)
VVSSAHAISSHFFCFFGQKSNSRVIFDVMNEPNGIPASTAFALVNASLRQGETPILNFCSESSGG